MGHLLLLSLQTVVGQILPREIVDLLESLTRVHIGKRISLLILTEIGDQVSDGSSALCLLLLVLAGLVRLLLHRPKPVKFALNYLLLGLLIHLGTVKFNLFHFFGVQGIVLEVMELGKHFLDGLLLCLVVATLGEQSLNLELIFGAVGSEPPIECDLDVPPILGEPIQR